MRRFVLLVLLTMSVLGGCSTIQVRQVDNALFDPKQFSDPCSDLCGATPQAYGGTVQAAQMLVYPVSTCGHGEGGLVFSTVYLVGFPIVVPLLAADLALTTAIETVILPYTAYRQATVGDVCPSAERIAARREYQDRETAGKQKRPPTAPRP